MFGTTLIFALMDCEIELAPVFHPNITAYYNEYFLISDILWSYLVKLCFEKCTLRTVRCITIKVTKTRLCLELKIILSSAFGKTLEHNRFCRVLVGTVLCKVLRNTELLFCISIWRALLWQSVLTRLIFQMEGCPVTVLLLYINWKFW